ncbi:RNA pseudourine synthase 2 chloroplastic-like, partial [Trifolium medium]|nr:RNA pseudourine synthase 2 chloroplastic-like [Trifolium medium]
IRAHAKYLGVPLLGDEVYGGTKSMVLSLLRPRTAASLHSEMFKVVSELDRPCLHALTLGFQHPHTGEQVHFSCEPPVDFNEILSQLRRIGKIAGPFLVLSENVAQRELLRVFTQNHH